MSDYEHEYDDGEGDGGDGMDFITALDRVTMVERLHEICTTTGKGILMYADGPNLIIEPMDLYEGDDLEDEEEGDDE